MTYYDLRNDRPLDGELSVDVYFSHSHDGGKTWDEVPAAGPFDGRTTFLDPSPLLWTDANGQLDPSGPMFSVGCDCYGLAAVPDGFAAAFMLAAPVAPEPPTDIFYAHLVVPINRTTGGGWLSDGKGGKISFGFHAEETDAGRVGELELNDVAPGAKLHLTNVTYLGAPRDGCSSFTGAGALELDGSGTYNGVGGASFRVCVQDNGDPGVGVDRISLACTKGCSYTTGTQALDDVIDGGNIRVGGAAAGDGCGRTLILDPLLAGNTNGALTVTVYDGEQQRLPNASVTLRATTSVGIANLATAVTDVNGTATFPSLGLAAEYTASVGCVESNAVRLSGPLP